MSVYKKVMAYTLSEYTASFGVYKSHGVFLDQLKFRYDRYWRSLEFQEMVVMELEGDTEPVQNVRNATVYLVDDNGVQAENPVFQSLWHTDNAFRHYYNTDFQQKLEEVTQGRKHFVEVTALQYHTKMYEEPTFPMHVCLMRDEQNGEDRFFCRIKTNPNWDGMRSPGKIFFPDKTWAAEGLYAGEAEVTIKFQVDNYGILLGKMIPVDIPTDEEVLDYLWESRAPGTFLVERRNIAGLGEVLCQEGDNYGEVLVYTKKPQSPECRFGIYKMKVDLGAAYRKSLIKAYSVNDIILHSKFGDDFNIEKVVAANFTKCYFMASPYALYRPRTTGEKNYVLDAAWVAVSKHLDDELLMEGYEQGLLEVRELVGYNIYSLALDPNNYVVFSTFEEEDVVKFLQRAAEFNHKANEEIKAKLRKGTLRLRT